MWIHLHFIPPWNKTPAGVNPFLPRLKGLISSFKALSTITFIYRYKCDWGVQDNVHKGWRNGRSGPVWTKITDLAISQLGGSTAEGPKMLKFITIWGEHEFGPESVVEEVVV